MKILRVQLENINSLKGRWQIDFTDYRLFAIVGDTGAGKTTILDAICLALYGRTPRIKEISKNQNELMHKNAGYLEVQLEFAIDDKQYMCRFYQHRANKSPKGNLQHSKRELSIYKDGKYRIITDKKADIDAKIASILLMDFEQFKRAILLAQGDFAEFLNSSADTRGEMLERITGTEIYSAMSIKAYNKNKDYQQRLSELQGKLSDSQDTSLDYDDVLQALREQEEVQQKHTTYCRTLEQQYATLQHYRQLSDDKQRGQQALATARAATSAFAVQQERLEQHYKSEHITPLFSAWRNATVHGEHLETNLKQYLNDEQVLNKAQDELHQQGTALKQALEHLQAQYNENHPKWQQAIRYDQELAQLKNTLDGLDRDYSDCQNAQSTTATQLKDANESQVATHSALQDIQAYLDNPDHANSGRQLTELTRLQADFIADSDTYHTALTRLTAHQSKKDDLTAQENKLQNTQKQIDNDLAQLSTTAKQSAERLQNKLSTPLDKHSYKAQVATLHTTISTLEKHLYSAEQLARTESSLKRKKDELSDLQNDINDILRQQTTAEKQQQTLEQDYAASERLYSLAQETLTLRQRLARLEAGQPCPLCGATSHPYRTQPPITQDVSQIQQEFEQARTALHACQATITQLQHAKEHKQNQYNKEQAQWQQAYDEYAVQMNQLKAQIAPYMHLNDNPLSAQLSAVIENTKHNYNALVEAIDDYEHDQEQLATARHEAQKITTEHQQIQRELAVLTPVISDAKDSLRLAHDRLHKNVHQLVTLIPQSDHLKSWQNLQDAITAQARYNKSDYVVLLEALTQQLQAQEAAYQKADKELASLNAKLATIKENIAALNSKQNLQQTQMAQLTQNRDSTSSAIEELQQARRQLLPDEANPALLIDQATNEIHQSQTQLASCRTSYAEKRNQLKAIAHNIQEVKQKITDNQLVVDQAYKTLTQSLHQHGFRDINAYHVAILPPSERAQLQATKEQLKRDTDLAEQDLKQLGEQLAKISTQYSDIATWDDDTQQEAIAKAQADSEQLAQEIAKLQAQKHTIEAKQAEHQARYEALQTLKKEALVWQQLNDLIGSATGKKFRNYVQEIHLQHLLDYANAQLNKMHKRYELVVSLDEQTKLGIDIIDYAQGGQTRSTKNLSGGEQFIISLALALGLSQFSSQNRPIYSLFLDEGFGTLDDTHLAIALSTLNELHNAGKTIGIISHVPSLKEQISTQISVKKQANGESIISGQGVSRLS